MVLLIPSRAGGSWCLPAGNQDLKRDALTLETQARGTYSLPASGL